MQKPHKNIQKDEVKENSFKSKIVKQILLKLLGVVIFFAALGVVLVLVFVGALTGLSSGALMHNISFISKMATILFFAGLLFPILAVFYYTEIIVEILWFPSLRKQRKTPARSYYKGKRIKNIWWFEIIKEIVGIITWFITNFGIIIYIFLFFFIDLFGTTALITAIVGALLDSDGFLTVYHGHAKKTLRNSNSWTIEPEIAHFFGNRNALFMKSDKYYVVTGKVRLEDVIAYVTDRKETEIVVLQGDVSGKKKEFFTRDKSCENG